MVTPSQEVKIARTLPSWYRQLSKYEKPNTRKAVGQILNTFLPYLALVFLMVWMLHRGVSYTFVFPLGIVAAGLVVRIFIFQHDCGHGSFLASRRANRLLGYICGVLTFTPFEDWRQNHAAHHSTAQDLDRRGIGDIPTLTVAEYRNASAAQRFSYRFRRHPIFMFGVGPALQFVIGHRFAHKQAGKRERQSVLITNLVLAALLGIACFTIGLRAYLLIQMPIIVGAASFGVWLFYVQHQYEDVYWAPHHEWDPIRAALEGSSFYRLPKVLQWFSGNIGLHHIHHLRPRIPNYHLQQCYEDVPELQEAHTLTLFASLKCISLHLWDEKTRQLVSYRASRLRRS